jgi:hypothetical protein
MAIDVFVIFGVLSLMLTDGIRPKYQAKEKHSFADAHPIKAHAAFSEAERRSLKEFYDNTLSTRLNTKREGAIVLVMQRLHQDDLVGHVTSREDREVSAIPAIEVEDRDYRVDPRPGDVYHRCEGEVVQDSREDHATLAN